MGIDSPLSHLVPARRANNEENWLRRAQHFNWEMLLYALIFCLALFTRFHILGARVMSHDESLHTHYSRILSEEGHFTHSPLTHGPLLFEINAFIYALLGVSDFTSRIYPALLGVLLVLSPLLFRYWLGKYWALIASLLILISPITLYYNRYIRHDTPVLFYALLLIWSALMYMEGPPQHRGRTRWLYLLTLSTLLCFASKENTFIYIAIFASFLTFYWLLRVAERYRNFPAQRVFETTLLATLIGGLLAIVLIGILAIAAPNQNSLPARLNFIGESISNWFSPASIPPVSDGSVDQFELAERQGNRLSFHSFLLWSGALLVITVGILIVPAYQVYRRLSSIPWREIIGILLLAMAICLMLLVIESRSLAVQPISGPETIADEYRYPIHSLPLFIAWGGSCFFTAGAIYLKRRGFWRAMRAFAEFDVLIVLGTLTLPWLSALLIVGMGQNFTYGDTINHGILTDIARAVVESLRTILPITFPFYDEGNQSFSAGSQIAQIIYASLTFWPFIITAAAIGLVWDTRRWFGLASLFFGLYIFLFTSFLANIGGLSSGLLSSLGYWLGQQGVRRGSQPQYYYTAIILPIYEYLPVLGSLLATTIGIRRYWQRRLEASRANLEGLARAPLSRISWPALFAWWGIISLFGYTLAGEKMPWLSIHLSFPLILLTAWFLARLLKDVIRQKIGVNHWWILSLTPGLLWLSWGVLAPILLGTGPFQGLSGEELRNTTRWLGALFFLSLLIGWLYRIVRRNHTRQSLQTALLGFFIVLAILTTRTSFAASFVNYDYPTEFLVYAHGAPQVKTAISTIREISNRVANGPGMQFAYAGDDISWPMIWYMREFPNALYLGPQPDLTRLEGEDVFLISANLHNQYTQALADDYIHHRYFRIWWPNQQYFNLQPESIQKLFDFSPYNLEAAELRAGIFDILWERDYRKFLEASNHSTDPGNWNPASTMYLYVRHEVAARVWPHGLEGLNNPYAQNEVLCPYDDGLYSGTILFEDPDIKLPIGLTASQDSIYLLDEITHQLSQYTSDGKLIRRIGQLGAVTDIAGTEATVDEGSPLFQRPNGMALAEAGSLFIADTWNFRIQELSAAGETENQWGTAFEFGENAPPEPFDGFWGPRDLALDSDGNVYVADTGNKRIRVYDREGNHLYDVGSSGNTPGKLQEPGSIAIDREREELYISEWWNQRVSVFSLAGEFQRSFEYPIKKKRDSVAAQIAVDSQRGLVYLNIPLENRILVTDRLGNCLIGFGPNFLDPSLQFGNITDLALDERGNLLVADAAKNQVIRFPPYQQSTE